MCPALHRIVLTVCDFVSLTVGSGYQCCWISSRGKRFGALISWNSPPHWSCTSGTTTWTASLMRWWSCTTPVAGRTDVCLVSVFWRKKNLVSERLRHAYHVFVIILMFWMVHTHTHKVVSISLDSFETLFKVTSSKLLRYFSIGANPCLAWDPLESCQVGLWTPNRLSAEARCFSLTRDGTRSPQLHKYTHTHIYILGLGNDYNFLLRLIAWFPWLITINHD